MSFADIIGVHGFKAARFVGGALCLLGGAVLLCVLWMIGDLTYDWLAHAKPAFTDGEDFLMFSLVIAVACSAGYGIARHGIRFWNDPAQEANAQSIVWLLIVIAAVICAVVFIHGIGIDIIRLRWIGAAILGTFWAIITACNIHIIWLRYIKHTEPPPSMIFFVGILFGMLAINGAPIHSQQIKWALRLLVILSEPMTTFGTGTLIMSLARRLKRTP